MFEVTVSVMPDNTVINALEGVIAYPEDILELKMIKDGNSIIPLWIQRPTSVNNTVVFSGIIPGGFEGVIRALTFPEILPGEIFVLQFKALKQGVADITIQEARALLHDGLGTEIFLVKNNAQINVDSYFFENVIEIDDTDSPIILQAEIIREEDLFSGNRALIFQVSDKGSGIDYVEVKEFGIGWQKAESPYELKRKSGSVQIRVFDKNNNQTRLICLR